jgi:hypothetical protein
MAFKICMASSLRPFSTMVAARATSSLMVDASGAMVMSSGDGRAAAMTPAPIRSGIASNAARMNQPLLVDYRSCLKIGRKSAFGPIPAVALAPLIG